MSDFILFNKKIINKRDIIMMYKVTNNAVTQHGILLVIRNTGESIEWYDCESERDARFESLTNSLC